MFDKLKKHSVKIFVFAINIILMAIAVLVIREKDQGRLLKQAENDASPNIDSSSVNQPSFEGQINQSVLENQPVQKNQTTPSATTNFNNTPSSSNNSLPRNNTTTNRKTKTS